MTKEEYAKWAEIAKATEPERENFRLFAENFFLRHKKEKLFWNWHLDLIVENYLKAIEEQSLIPVSERKVKIVLFNVPPRSGKTEFILKLLPIWLGGHQEKLKFISTSYSTATVQKTAKETRDYWISDEFRLVFPWRSELDISEKSKGAWMTPKGFQYYSTGSGGSITGFGADIFNIDDPSKPDEVARTGNELSNINDWFGNTVFSRLNANGLKIIFVIMQRLADNDLCGYLLSSFAEEFKSGEFWHISIPAIAEKDDEFRKKGESFFPTLYSLQDLAQKKRVMNAKMGSHHFAAQYQQNPIDTENSEFKESFFQYFRHSEENPRKFRQVWMGVDVALSEKAQSDWRSAVVVGQDDDGRFFVLENYHSRKNSGEVQADLFDLQKKWKCDVVVEANGSQKYFSDSLRSRMQIVGQYFLLKEISGRSDKNARLRSTLLPLYENGRIFHERKLEGGEMESEILRFPKSKHDDNMDALETAISAFWDFGVSEKMESSSVQGDDVFFGKTQDDPRNSLLRQMGRNVESEKEEEWWAF